MSKEVENRPWGNYQTIFEDNLCKVKKIVIKPNQAPSYQYHFKRQEVWIIIEGSGELKLDDKIIEVSKGSIVQVLKEQKHQIRNTSDQKLVFIEVQTGDYFGEDDIVRVEDDYGRL